MRAAQAERVKGTHLGKPALGSYINRDGYRCLTMQRGHPIADKSGQIKEHRKVLYDAIGPGPHPCHWGCGRMLKWGGCTGLHADHVNGENLDNRIENLVPSCRSCNSKRRHAGNPADWHVSTHSGTPACQRGHDFTPENTYVNKRGKRQCRTCHRDRQAGYAEKRKLAAVSSWTSVSDQ